MRKIYIIEATGNKSEGHNVLPAQEIYTDQAFVNCKNVLEEESLPWLILSKMHGLIWPNSRIIPYNEELMSDSEVYQRLARTLQNKQILANTIIGLYALTKPKSLELDSWRLDVLKTTEFILVGNEGSACLAMTEAALHNFKVTKKDFINFYSEGEKCLL